MAQDSTKQNTIKLVKASARHLHISPRKMRLATDLLRNMNVSDAIVQLQHMNKKAAVMLIKLLKSAVANAKNNFSLDPEHLYIKNITTDMGKMMKRYFPRARGSAFVIKRKMCHVNVELEERKKGKQAKSRLDLFSAKGGSAFGGKKAESADKPENVDQKQATGEKPEKGHIKQETHKTDEQRKMNKMQNKRRLFDRRAGE